LILWHTQIAYNKLNHKAAIAAIYIYIYIYAHPTQYKSSQSGIPSSLIVHTRHHPRRVADPSVGRGRVMWLRWLTIWMTSWSAIWNAPGHIFAYVLFVTTHMCKFIMHYNLNGVHIVSVIAAAEGDQSCLETWSYWKAAWWWGRDSPSPRTAADVCMLCNVCIQRNDVLIAAVRSP